MYNSLSMYERICGKIARSNYKIYTVEQFLKENPSCGFIILRHDVDAYPLRALEMANIEHAYGIKSTYYFRYIPNVFNVEVIKSIKSMGHEIGYHYETLNKCKGNLPEAVKLFEKEINEIRRIGIDIKTVCAHGSENQKVYGLNTNIFKYDLQLEKKVNIIGEAYLNIDFANVKYITDWKVYTHTSNLLYEVFQRGEENYVEYSPSTVTEIYQLIDRVLSSYGGRFYISIHPQYYIKERYLLTIMKIRSKVSKEIAKWINFKKMCYKKREIKYALCCVTEP